MYVYVNVCACICICVCVYVCMDVCMHVWFYLCGPMPLRTYIHKFISTCILLHRPTGKSVQQGFVEATYHLSRPYATNATE